jgi:hypothetical protein
MHTKDRNDWILIALMVIAIAMCCKMTRGSGFTRVLDATADLGNTTVVGHEACFVKSLGSLYFPVNNITSTNTWEKVASGTSGWSWQLYTDDGINVKWAGALGDGVTDDTAAIQLALSLAGASTASSVFFPTGNYIVSDTLTVVSNTRIYGEGEGSFINMTSADADANCFDFTTGSLDDLVIHDLRIRGQSSNDASGANPGGGFYRSQSVAIHCKTSTGTMERLRFYNLRLERFRIGIRIEQSSATLRVENPIIRNCWFDEMGTAAIMLEGTDHAVIDNCHIDLDRTGVGNGTDTQLGIWALADNINKDLKITNVSTTGGGVLEVFNLHSLRTIVSNCSLDGAGAATSAIMIEPTLAATASAYDEGSMYSVISSCNVTNFTGSAIVVRHDPVNNAIGVNNISINNNTVDTTGIAIAVGHGSEGDATTLNKNVTVNNNVIKNATSFGIRIQDAEMWNVNNNVMEEVDVAGIRIVGSNNGTIAGNHIESTTANVDGVVIAGASADIVMRGGIIEVPRAGFVFSDTTDRVQVFNTAIYGTPTRGGWNTGSGADFEIVDVTVSGATSEDFLNFNTSDIYYNDGTRYVWQDGTGKIVFTDVGTDEATKNFRLMFNSYTNSAPDVIGMHVSVSQTINSVNIGGGSAQGNAATVVKLYTAEDNDTTTGTLSARITNTTTANDTRLDLYDVDTASLQTVSVTNISGAAVLILKGVTPP